MGTSWRRAFCTSISREPETITRELHAQPTSPDSDLAPQICAKLSLFSRSSGGSSSNSNSNPSTPRLASEPNLRCRTKKCKSFPDSKAQTFSGGPSAKTPTISSTPKWSPSLFQRRAFSNPSSPRSPSKFTLFKHFSRSRCRLCSQSLKTKQETPVFTAECSHAFHFPCITAKVRSDGNLICPVCSVSWKQAPFLSAINNPQTSEGPASHQQAAADVENRNPNKRIIGCSDGRRNGSGSGSKGYDDDEPLLAVSNTGQGGAMRFNPIPEAAEEEDFVEDECQGFLANDNSRMDSRSEWPANVEVSVMPEAVLASAGRKHNNYVVALKVKAPPLRSVSLLDPSSRAAIDLVTVLDVTQGMTGEKLQMLKRAMRLLISSLGAADRLSVVAFSSVAGAKRLLPLRRMSRHGQRSARQVVERLVVVSNGVAGTGIGGQGASVGDALRKATKVLEDRRERNPVATIMLLSDTSQQQQGQQQEKEDGNRGSNQDHCKMNSPCDTNPQPSQSTVRSAAPTVAATTRFAHLEIPMDASIESGTKATVPLQQLTRSDDDVPAYEDAFSKCVGGLLSVVMQNVHLEFVFPTGEIASVYRANGGIGYITLDGRPNLVRLGDLYAEEEKELLVELRVPAEQNNQLHHLAVKCSYKDPATQELLLCAEQPILLPPFLTTLASRSSLRLRNLFVWTRAITESRRLAELSDYSTAHHLLCSARSLLLQSISGGGVSEPAELHHYQKLIRGLESEIGELQVRRQQHSQHCASRQQQQQPEDLPSPTLHRRMGRQEAGLPAAQGTGGGEALTPTSAWRAAEQLAKVAIMRKSLNRVSDLHGFENARF